ncbi:aminopeptidase N [Drosophila innubila]|uniref:aminopeptidase N n=1 Tax=Drosophila innubila TaxID=198719 RepID=UPI00148E387D|nr:aminopeptidase N [Drosophila innubila]
MQIIRFFLLLLMSVGVLSMNDPYRLTDLFKPEHYNLRILTHLNGPNQLRFEGQVKIHFHVLDQTRNITLNAKNLTIDQNRVTLSSQSGNNCIVNAELNEDKELYILHLCEVLQQTVKYELIIPFKGPLNSNDTGYYWSSFQDSLTNQTSYLAVTQFSPTFARLAFPCFDEPHLKATFRVTLGYHRNYTGFSNTPIAKCEDHETLANYIWCEHEPIFRTSTYLVAYAVHNLTRVATQSIDTVHNVTFSSWVQPKVVNEAHFLSNLAPKVLSHLEKLLEYSFPLRKVDQLAVPTHKFSAMENWGLITFKESKFVHNDREEMLESKESKSSTMAHEYAHQWFGNLVTMKWWNDLWLKEGPSTYFGYLTLDALMPDWGTGDRYFANDLATFFRQDAINSTIPISRDVQGSESILKQFSEYVYKKGSLTVRMLHKLLGDEIFYSGIRSYVKKHAYDSVVQTDLWQVMEEAVNAHSSHNKTRVSTVMDSWTLQAGYPIVSVNRNYTTASVTVNQTRFWLVDDEDHPASCWWIPLTFVTQQQANFNMTQPQFWLKCPKIDRTLELLHKPTADEWIILNPQVNTIYRVNYDDRNWRLIINTLNSAENFGGVHELNRAQLMDDLMALAWKEMQSYELAFSLLEYLPLERHYIPWKRILDVLNRHGDLLSYGNANIFRMFIRKLVASLYERCPSLESLQTTTTSIQEITLCRLAYAEACRYGLENCTDQAMGFTLETDEEQVPVDFRDIVFCTNIEFGNEMQFELMMQRFQNKTFESRKSAWATGLGCSRNFTQLQQFLDYLLQSTEATTGNYYVEAVTSALHRKYVALETSEHILQHATILNDKLNAKQIKSLVLLLVENDTIFIKEEKLQELKSLKKFKEPLELAVELRKVNQKWLTERSQEFIRVLTKYI